RLMFAMAVPRRRGADPAGQGHDLAAVHADVLELPVTQGLQLMNPDPRLTPAQKSAEEGSQAGDRPPGAGGLRTRRCAVQRAHISVPLSSSTDGPTQAEDRSRPGCRSGTRLLRTLYELW